MGEEKKYDERSGDFKDDSNFKLRPSKPGGEMSKQPVPRCQHDVRPTIGIPTLADGARELNSLSVLSEKTSCVSRTKNPGGLDGPLFRTFVVRVAASCLVLHSCCGM